MAEEKNLAHSSLRRQAIGMIIGLIVEYILGMSVTLFVQFPSNEHNNQLWTFAWRQVPLALHIVVGILLLLGSAALLFRAIRLKSNRWIAPSSIALVAIYSAIIGGSVFVPSQRDIYSLIMALGFILALLSYFWGLYADSPTKSKNVKFI